MITTFIIVATFIIFSMNQLMEAFCAKKEIPAEKQPEIIRTSNVLTTILLISAYIEVLFT